MKIIFLHTFSLLLSSLKITAFQKLKHKTVYTNFFSKLLPTTSTHCTSSVFECLIFLKISLVKHVDVTGGCKSSKGSARSLLMSSSYGSRDGGLTVLRTNMRPDVIMTMEMKPGITGVWSLSSVVENEEEDEEEEEEEEDCFLLFGTNKGKTRLIHFKKEKNEDGGSISIPTPMSSKKVGKNSFLMTETTLLSGNLLNGRGTFNKKKKKKKKLSIFIF